MQNICPQCKNTLKTPSCRLIQDACGHQKCRLCLLKDEEKCSLCVSLGQNSAVAHDSVIKYENNHTAVIAFKSSSDVNKEETINNDSECNDIKQKEKSEINKRFYQTLPIPSHIILSNDVPVIYTCKICGRKFKTRSHVKYHHYCASGL